MKPLYWKPLYWKPLISLMCHLLVLIVHTSFNREQKTVQRCCDVIQVRFVYQTKSEILTYCTGKITKFYKAIYIDFK